MAWVRRRGHSSWGGGSQLGASEEELRGTESGTVSAAAASVPSVTFTRRNILSGIQVILRLKVIRLLPEVLI